MQVLSLLTILHLLVDGVCGAVLAIYALQEPRLEPIVFYFGLYTVLAFGLQGPIGWLLDGKPAYLRQSLVASTLLLAIGAMPQLPIGGQAVFLGLGNCLFHVTGGSYVLRQYNTYTELGLFVCSGAIGLGFGLNSIIGVWPLLGLACIITAFTAIKIEVVTEGQRTALVAKNIAIEGTPLQLLAVAALLFSCIVLRGFGSGGGLYSPYIMLLPCTFSLGKLLGGVACDRIGYKRTVLLIFVLGFIALQLQGLAASLLFILTCNMTMPLTLRLAHWCRIGAPGLMFGLAATCLVPGTIFKGYLNFPPQVIIVLQFLILFIAGYLLLPKEYRHV